MSIFYKTISVYSASKGACMGDVILWLRDEMNMDPTRIKKEEIQIDHNIQTNTPKHSDHSKKLLSDLGLKYVKDSMKFQISKDGTHPLSNINTILDTRLSVNYKMPKLFGIKFYGVKKEKNKERYTDKSHIIGLNLNGPTYSIHNSVMMPKTTLSYISKEELANVLAQTFSQYFTLWNVDTIHYELAWYPPLSPCEKFQKKLQLCFA